MKNGDKGMKMGEGWIIVCGLTLFVLLSLVIWMDRLPRRIDVGPVRSVSGEALATPEPEKVDINAASVEELAGLPGIGEELAGRIAAYREENGPFGSLDALDEVEGIGAGKIAALERLAFAGGADAPG